MLAFKVFLFIALVRCGGAAEVEPVDSSTAPSVPASTSPSPPPELPLKMTCRNSGQMDESKDVRLDLPFTEMEIQRDRRLQLIQEPTRQNLFVLHAGELFFLTVSRAQKRLDLLGVLQGRVADDSFLNAAIIAWGDFVLIVVALSHELEVYQIPMATIEDRLAALAADPKQSNRTATPAFQPIQRLSLSGGYRNHILASVDEQRVMLIVTLDRSRSEAMLRTFDWLQTYFNPLEDRRLPADHRLYVIGEQRKYILVVERLISSDKTKLTSFEVVPPSLALKHIQTISIKSPAAHPYSFEGRNFIVVCPVVQSEQNCAMFQQSQDGRFAIYQQHVAGEDSFDRIVAGKHFIVASQENHTSVYADRSLSCVASFGSPDGAPQAVLIHLNAQREDFILMAFEREDRTVVRMLSVTNEREDSAAQLGSSAQDTQGMSELSQHRHVFEDVVGKVRSLLLKRNGVMSQMSASLHGFLSKTRDLWLTHGLTVLDGTVGAVAVEQANLVTPTQLLRRISEFRQRILSRQTRSLKDASTKIGETLQATNLWVKDLVIDGDFPRHYHLDKLSTPLRTLHVDQALKARTVDAERLTRKRRDLMVQPASGVVKVRDLQVQTLNRISWNDFHASLFLRNANASIAGRLILQAPVAVKSLSAKVLNGRAVQQFFNLREEQIVNSSVLISRFFVSDLQANTLNGLHFAEDVVFRGTETLVETPVNLYQASIGGDLLVGSNGSYHRQPESTRLQQHYTGKVIIKGDLHVKNLKREDPATSAVVVDGKPFSEEDIRQRYMLEQTPQVFNKTVQFGNAKVSAPSFATAYLNQHPTEDHLLRHGGQLQGKPIFLVFMLASIEGDLRCLNYNSSVWDLDQQAVRHGSVANITGTKKFTGSLAVDDLMTLALNELPVSDLVVKSLPQSQLSFSGQKFFKRIQVERDAYVGQDVLVASINGRHVRDLLNHDCHFGSVHLRDRLQAKDVIFHTINGISFDDIFTKLQLHGDQLVLHKDLIIEGNVHFNEGLALKHLNGIEWAGYADSLVRSDEDARIEGPKSFLNELTVTKELRVPSINGLQLEKAFPRMLSRTRPQQISGVYSFGSMHATNVDVSVVNSVATASFLDTREQEIIIEGDVYAPKVVLRNGGSLKGNFVHSLELSTLVERLNALPSRRWRNIVVHGSAHWNESSPETPTNYEQLAYLHKNAVRRSGDQRITGSVKLHRPCIGQMSSQTSLSQDIDIDFIAKDCLLRHSATPQFVYGAKTFLNPIRANEVEANGFVGAKRLNSIDILRFNASLYRALSGLPIVGPLQFRQQPSFDCLTVEGGVNGVTTDRLYHLPHTPLPPLRLRRLVIDESLELGEVNGMHLEDLLRDRVTKHGEAVEVFGSLTLENAVLEKAVAVSSINGIPIDSLVLTKSAALQVITGRKTVTGGAVKLRGPANVMHVNGHDLVASYEDSVFVNRNNRFDALSMDEATFQGGLLLN